MGIVERNVQQLEKKFLENIEYRDIDYRGYIDATTDPVLNSSAVLINDLKLWLQSSKGDYYRRWDRGGYFDANLREFPLSDEGAEALTEDLRATLTTEFPTVEILVLEIQPNYTKRGWQIKMVIKDKLTGAMAPVETGVLVE